MDILLRRKYQYPVAASFETMKQRLASQLSDKWIDASRDYKGEVQDDGSFTFKPVRGPLFSFRPFGETAYLRGWIEEKQNDSIVHITISPNVSLVLAIYILLLVLLNVWFVDNSFMGEKSGRFANSLIILLFEAILFGAIFLRSANLKNAFEKAVINTKPKYQVKRP